MAFLPGVGLVTGAGGAGIGRGIALAFSQAGCRRLIITDINEKTLDESLEFIKANSPVAAGSESELIAVVGDISSPEFITSLFSQIKARFGRLDYLVNNAGVQGNNERTDKTPLEEFDRITSVNFRGLWLCSKAALNIMKDQDIEERPGVAEHRRQRGAIVNIASQLGLVSRPDAPVYVAAKHAVIGLTKSDAIDYSKDRIRVNAVCPGVIKTPLLQSSRPGEKPVDISAAVNIAPMMRMATTDEVADVVAFLASEKASFVQGAAYVVDGGYTIN